MGKCYCDYCDVFLTNDSVAVRKQHNEGNRHKHNVCEYYRQYVGQQLQEQIDEIVAIFEVKVARGLIRPTYGLPPTPKPQQQPQSQSGTQSQPKQGENQATSEIRSPEKPGKPNENQGEATTDVTNSGDQSTSKLEQSSADLAPSSPVGDGDNDRDN